MARRTSFKFQGSDLEAWVGNIKNEVSKQAAVQIVRDLKVEGPFYTGEFEGAWRVELGDVAIAATRPPSNVGKQSSNAPTPIKGGVPEPRGRKSVTYTIGNEMEYRDIAMDLDPGQARTSGNKKNTARRDWFRRYIEGGPLRNTLKRVTQQTAQIPSIRNFKGEL
jgi:hypothetical protein